MSDPSRSSRRVAARLFLVACLVLVGGSLSSPGVIDVWAETRSLGWQRSLARMWSQPVDEVSRVLHLGTGRRLAYELSEGDVKPVVTLPPATRPSGTRAGRAIGTIIQSPIPTVTTTTVAGLLRTGTPTTTQVSGKTMVAMAEVDSSTTGHVANPPSTTGHVANPPSTTGHVANAPSTTGRNFRDALPTKVLSTPTTASPGLVAIRQATRDEPLRILGVGDSLMLDLQYGLERILAPRIDVTVEGRGALGFGFVVPFWDWEEDVLPDYDHMVATFRPDVVVVMIGANEFQGYAIEGEDLMPGSERWREVLGIRADEAIAHWLAGGALLYWWTTPTMADASYLTRDLNEVWASAVTSWEPLATTLDSMGVLGDENGDFRWHLTMSDGSLLALRKKHGVHFHEVGADMLARQLEKRLMADGWLTSDD